MMTGNDDNTATDDSAAAAAHAHAQLAPLFLLPVLPDVIMAGKSMHMLQRLDRTQQVHPGRSIVRSFVRLIHVFTNKRRRYCETVQSNIFSSFIFTLAFTYVRLEIDSNMYRSYI